MRYNFALIVLYEQLKLWVLCCPSLNKTHIEIIIDSGYFAGNKIPWNSRIRDKNRQESPRKTNKVISVQFRASSSRLVYCKSHGDGGGRGGTIYTSTSPKYASQRVHVALCMMCTWIKYTFLNRNNVRKVHDPTILPLRTVGGLFVWDGRYWLTATTSIARKKKVLSSFPKEILSLSFSFSSLLPT